MDKMPFFVQGSSTEPYEVIFKLEEEYNLSACCTCQVGQKDTHCKHRVQSITGENRRW